jgi:hypothetical protein
LRIMQLPAAVDGEVSLKATQRMPRTDSSVTSLAEGREKRDGICGV